MVSFAKLYKYWHFYVISRKYESEALIATPIDKKRNVRDNQTIAPVYSNVKINALPYYLHMLFVFKTSDGNKKLAC